MPDAQKTQKVFSDPETQALHERNLEWLRLMEEDPGWALSRFHRLAELEEQLEAAQDVLRRCERWLRQNPDAAPLDLYGQVQGAIASNRRSVLLYDIWPKDSSTRLFPWTRDFITCHGWSVYFWDILWHSVIQYRLLNWRCWFGHRLGEPTWWYEEGFRYEGMRECKRSNCEFFVEVED